MPIIRYPKKIQHLPRSLQIIIREFVRRIDKGRNCLVCCVGSTGSGKSLAMVSLLYWIFIYMKGREPTVDEIRYSWFFRVENFLEKMNSNSKLKQRWLWDETGVDLSHKSHSTIQNRAVGWLVQSFRNLQQIVLFTTPTLAFIDASVRKLIHYQLEVRGIDKKHNICVIKPLRLQYNVRLDKIFYHNLCTPAVDGTDFIDEVDVVKIPRPPKEIEKAYEKDKNEFTSELNREILRMIQKVKKKNEVKEDEDEPLRPLTPRQKKILNLLKGGLTRTKDIAEVIQVKDATISENFKWMRGKGLNLDKFFKDKGKKKQ